MSVFQPWVVSEYEASRSKHVMPIEEYVESVVRNMPAVNEDEIYEPIQVDVVLSGKYNCVPLQTDFSEGWYGRLKDAVGTMIGHKASDIALRDIIGQDIGDIVQDAHDLESLGKVKAYCRGHRVDLPVLPEPPKHMANDTLQQMATWFDQDIREPMVELVASELQGATKYELQTRTGPASTLEKKIQNLIQSKCIGGDMRDFMYNFGSNVRAKSTPPADVLKNISGAVLRHVRQSLRGAEKRIDKHLAAKTQEALGDEEHLFESSAAIGAKLQDEKVMYSRLARKAMTASKMDLIHHVYRATPNIACDCKSGEKEEEESDDKYYSDYYYGQDMYDKYQTYSGGAVFMEIQKPILRGARLHKKRYKEEQQQKQIRTFLPFEEVLPEMPRLVPTKSRYISEEIPIKSKEMPRLVPIKSKEMPIESRYISEEMPRLVPIKSRYISEEMPRLVPIKSRYISEEMPIESREEMPRLVPIKSQEEMSIGPSFIEIEDKDDRKDINYYLEKRRAMNKK